MNRRSVFDQLVDRAIDMPAKERAVALRAIASDRTTSPAGRRIFLEAVRQAEAKQRRRATR